MFTKIIAFIMAILSTVSLYFADITDNYTFEIDASQTGDTISNKVSNVNIWMMGESFNVTDEGEKDDIFDFVEYVQLMQCTGGNADRDLFKDPYDTSVLDDYDFDRLINNCQGILDSGAKPCLKLGNVPMKYSKDCYMNGMEVNVLPPDDYDVYYNYIKAIAEALVEEFGKEELLTWHFTCFTEYENADWFECGTPEKSMEETCKMYDYITDALQKVIGEDIYIGAHSMTVTEGLWDEADFIKHCAIGTNYKTGEKGTRLCYLSASYYESAPGEVGKRKSLSQTIKYLRKNAEKYGLELDYGIDEGRILSASEGRDDSQLFSRTVGYTYQAAFDAKIYGTMIDENIDYFSMWGYKSDGLNRGVPTVSYHVARLVSKFTDSVKVTVRKVLTGLIPKAEVNACAGFNEEENTLHIMAYNYKNDINYNRKADICLKIKVPQFKDGAVKVTQYVVGDDCNYFDDWMADREKYGIGNDCFGWSPDCPSIGSNIIDGNARKIYNSNKDRYYECSKLKPITATVNVKNGEMEINIALQGNNVVFYEITQ